MLRSGKERPSDFPRLWLELEDHIRRRRRNLALGCFSVIGLIVGLSVIFGMVVDDGDAGGAACAMSGFFALFGMVILWSANSNISLMARKVAFAKEVGDALTDDYHPARKISYYLDLRDYDASDKRYWSGRSTHGNAKYKYLDRWFRQKFWLIDGTRVVVERKADHKVRKGSLIRHKRRVYVKIYPSEKSFGPGPFQGDSDLTGMVKQAIRDSFHDPPEVIRVRREGPRNHISLAITQLDAPIHGSEVVSLIEAVLLYLRMKG